MQLNAYGSSIIKLEKNNYSLKNKTKQKRCSWVHKNNFSGGLLNNSIQDDKRLGSDTETQQQQERTGWSCVLARFIFCSLWCFQWSPVKLRTVEFQSRGKEILD